MVFTGGHGATTAAAVIEEVKLRKYDWEISWIGSKYAIEGKKVFTLEYESLPGRGIKFFPITTGRLQRNFTIWTIPSILKTPLGFVESFLHLINIRPAVLLSFGGYTSFPVILAGKILGIPVIIHEQTAAAGRANRLTAFFADRVALAREESKKYFPAKKVLIVGNPVIKQIFSVKKKTEVGNPPTIFVTGGSRGSQKINEIAGVLLPKLLGSYRVIHQTGNLDFQKFNQIRRELPSGLAERYEVVARIDPQKIFQAFEQSDLVVSRSGANTVSDIIASRRPAVLIPLPISYLDEQTKNAEFAASLGIARIIPESRLTPDRLLFEVQGILTDFPKIIRKINSLVSPDVNAAQKLVDLLSLYAVKK